MAKAEVFPGIEPVLDEDGERVDVDEPACPACQVSGTLQHTDLAVRFWNLRTVTAEGRLEFDGHFDWEDGGRRERIACCSCGAEWAFDPSRVDFL